MGCCFGKDAVEEDKDAAIGENLNENLLRARKGDVFTKYEIIAKIGSGSMGDISKARVKPDKKGGSAYETKKKGFLGPSTSKSSRSVPSTRNEIEYALKTIILSRITPEFIEELQNEINILQGLDHPNIIKAYEVFSNKTQIYIVMQLCSGGDLYKRLPYSEKEAAKIVGKLLSAVKYCHDKGVVHRDLKFENIMFESKHPDAEIKLIDFGLSKKFLPGMDNYMTEGVGTIYSMAPQVLQGVYTSQADLWSCGVIAFMLLSSSKPFYHKRRKRVIDKIMRCEYSFKGVIWEIISPEAKDFVSKLLVMDPKRRMNGAKALSHLWLSKEFSLKDRKPSEALMQGVEGSLLAYKDTSDLKKVALNVIAHQSSTEEIAQLRNAFDQYDSSNDGVITFEEFKLALRSSKNYSDEQLTEMFESVDVNQNGHIMYTEFIAATLEVHGKIEEERLAEAFDRLDSDDSNYISKENLRRLLGDQHASKERIDSLISAADKDGDGQISFQEFLDFFREDTHKTAIKFSHLESSHRLSSEHSILLGLDAKIPGGKYDSAQN